VIATTNLSNLLTPKEVYGSNSLAIQICYVQEQQDQSQIMLL